MKRKPKSKSNGHLYLQDEQLATVRMQAIEVAARLPEPEPSGYGGMAQSFTRPGKSADKVVEDAKKIIAFITTR